MTSRTQTVTDAEVEALIVRLEQDAETCRRIGYPSGGGYQRHADILRALLTERAAHAHAVAQAREEGERAGIRKAATIAEQCAIGQHPVWDQFIEHSHGTAAMNADGVLDRMSDLILALIIPTPSQEDR
jgi:hypothetical protein